MQLIGLTGGIASGKSTVARRFAELGAVIVDADLLAREVVKPGTPALAAIEKEFGAGVIASDGSLNRPALGNIIFSDPERRQALNDITHPAVWARAKQLIADAAAADPDAVVIYDVPLLVEAAADRPLRFDLVVVVHASRESRLRRLIDLRNMPADAAAQRIASQASDADRLAIADIVIDTDGSLDHAFAQVDALWAKLRG